ncbi:MAG: hypothetical protein KBD47_03025 [Candidatus Pacebacteria bacterium]|nr:hypothetical protein [Candidatus Paceibacterota bacterium]
MSKYGKQSVDWFEALVNKIGGVERADAFLRGELVLALPSQLTWPPKLKIDRSNPYDPVASVGQNWKIGEEDIRAHSIVEFDVQKIILQTGLNEGEAVVTGEVKRTRLVSQAIQLDAKVAQTLFEEKGQVTLRWMHEHLNVTWIEFLGTVLVGPNGYRFALDLRRSVDGSWGWYCYWLDFDRGANSSAVGLAS